MEWSEKNKYSSFNSMKGLTYYENYRKILAWMDGKGQLPPPVECNCDIFAGCNVNCYFCITQRYLRTNPAEVGERRALPRDYVGRLVDFMSEWGVKGFCISGGGEPTLHKGFPGMTEYAVSKGMKAAVFTNGTNMNDAIADSLLACQFVSLSINAIDSASYKKIMGVDAWDIVNVNMTLLAKKKRNSETFLCVRMLVLPENYRHIYNVCLWAKNIGLSGFNVRPVDFEREDIQGHKALYLPVEQIKEEFARCHELEDENFKVFTITHKFDDCFHVKHYFPICLATPLLIPVLQDGNAYLCVDKKMEKDFKIGSCYPDPEKILEWWGSDRHRELIKDVDINKCSRCTFGEYQKQIREVVQQDKMMRSFP